MPVRLIAPKPGEQRHVETATPFELPAGLHSGSTVTVMGFTPGRYHVRDEAGVEFNIAMQCVQCEREHFWRERWLPESDPRILDRMRQELAAAEVEQCEPAVEWVRLAAIASKRQILARHSARCSALG